MVSPLIYVVTNATAFLLCWSKPWTDANVNIVPSSAMCDCACWWLFFSASASPFSWGRYVLAQRWVTTDWGVVCVPWQHFVGAWCHQEGWGLSDCWGADPERRERHCVSNEFGEGVRRDVAEVAQQCILRFSPPHVERGVGISVQLPFVCYGNVFTSSRWPNVKYRRWTTCSWLSIRSLVGRRGSTVWRYLTSPSHLIALTSNGLKSAAVLRKKTDKQTPNIIVSEEWSPFLNACVRFKFLLFPGEMMVFEHAVRTSLCFV